MECLGKQNRVSLGGLDHSAGTKAKCLSQYLWLETLYPSTKKTGIKSSLLEDGNSQAGKILENTQYQFCLLYSGPNFPATTQRIVGNSTR